MGRWRPCRTGDPRARDGRGVRRNSLASPRPRGTDRGQGLDMRKGYDGVGGCFHLRMMGGAAGFGARDTTGGNGWDDVVSTIWRWWGHLSFLASFCFLCLRPYDWEGITRCGFDITCGSGYPETTGEGHKTALGVRFIHEQG